MEIFLDWGENTALFPQSATGDKQFTFLSANGHVNSALFRHEKVCLTLTGNKQKKLELTEALQYKKRAKGLCKR